jgi:hypothetical protein
MPSVEDCLSSLGGAKYFSVLDAQSAYYHIPLDENSIPKTAFTTHRGLFEHLVTPFGLTNSPQVWQRLIEIVLAGLLWAICIVYLDDVIVFSENFAQHLARLREIFKRMREHNIKLKPSKCLFFKKEVKYLGHIITEDGVAPDPAKTEAVRNYPVPTTKRGVRSFLGFAGYYRRLIRDFAKIAKPLHDIAAEYKPFTWSDSQQNSFETLKNALLSAEVLAFPNFAIPFTLHVDASDTALGAVLVQADNNGVEHPIAFASRVLSENEAKWCATERECLAMVWAVEHFEPYLYGRKYELVTDHQALLWLRSLREPSKRLARWILALDPADFTIRHKAGKLHADADALSRIQHSQTPLANCVAAISFVNDIALSTADIIAAQRANATFAAIIDAKTSVNAQKPQLPPPLTWADRQLLRLWTFLDVHDNVLYWHPTGLQENGARRLLAPPSLREDILKAAHSAVSSGHFGADRTIARVQQYYYWPGMRRDILAFCQSCLECAVHNISTVQRRPPMTPIDSGRTPFEQIGLDFIGPLPRSQSGKTYALVVSDYFTRWPEFYALSSQDAEAAAKCLVDWISRYGCPRIIISDQGAAFESVLFDALCRRFGIARKRTTAYHPQTDGLVERVNRTLKTTIAKYVNDNKTDWPNLLPLVALAYRSSVHASTGFTPWELAYGRRPSLPSCLLNGELVDPAEPTPNSYHEFVENLHRRLLAIWDEAIDRSNVAKMRQTASYNARGTINRIFSHGDRVLLENPPSAIGDGALMPRRTGVWQVIEVFDNNVVRIANEQHPRTIKTVNVKRLAHLRDPPTFDATPRDDQNNAATQSSAESNDDEPAATNRLATTRRSNRQRQPRNFAALGLAQLP